MSAVEHKHPGYCVSSKGELRDVDRVPGDEDEGGWGIDTVPLTDDSFSYALGARGSTRRKLAAASGCIIEYVGRLACFAGYRQDRRFELMKLQTLQDGFITERQFNNMYAQFGGEFKCAPYLTGEPSITCPADRAEFEYTGCVERVVPEGTPSQSNGLSGYEYYPDPCDGAMENAFRFISGTDPRLQNDERYGKSVAWNLRTTLSNEGEGDIYYHNEGTNQAQWKRPVPEPADLPDGWIQKETRLVFTPKSKEIE